MRSGELKIRELTHERDLLQKQIEELTSSMSSSEISCSLTGISVQSVNELDKIHQLEIERQAAIDDFDTLNIKYQSLKKTSDAKQQQMKVNEERMQQF